MAYRGHLRPTHTDLNQVAALANCRQFKVYPSLCPGQRSGCKSAAILPDFATFDFERGERKWLAQVAEDGELGDWCPAGADQDLPEARQGCGRGATRGVQFAGGGGVAHRHAETPYLTTQCLDAPCSSAWMILYHDGTDTNFINTTSLTRPAFHQLLRRFVGVYYIRKKAARGRPSKLRYHHQVLGLVLSFYVGSM
ncbi:hypothetical protein PF004_g11716 [Phytophthora fragariae]|uniref:Uncharacterized protein n=1 Tax=Phytophthora fragariae TaxID=53985 RepID=A0A6G0NX61_9STRA|nr:hypothetical protein PF004_g11716 [Phytophthora fragariae]